MKSKFFIAGLILFFSCNSNQSKEIASADTSGAASAATPNLVYPYPVNYTDLKSDDQKNTVTVLNLWKRWDDGDLKNQAELWADSAEVHTWDGMLIKGIRDTIESSGERFRNNFSSVVSSVNGIISFTGTNKSTGQVENWAAVWGKRVTIDKKGKADSVWIHEGWRFNNEGKADMLFQFAAKITN